MSDADDRDRLNKLRRLKELQTKSAGVTAAPEKTGFIQDLDNILMKIPGIPQLAEIAAGANRSIVDTLDFIGPNNINSIFELAGSERRVPTVAEATTDVIPERGAFVGEGLQADVLGAAGEVVPVGVGISAALRAGAQALPKIGKQGENAIRGILRQLGIGPSTARGIVAQDVGLSAISGGGEQLGEEVGGAPGALIGAVLAPLSVTAGAQGIRSLLSSADGVRTLTSNLTSLSDEGASKLLSEAMVREGISPQDAARMLDDLGPEAIPADISNTFARLLRTASNEVPRIEGRAAQVFAERQGGQAARLFSALDDAAGVPGLNVDDEIQRLQTVFGPQINDLYAAARSRPLPLTPKLRNLLEGKNSIGRARGRAAQRLADRRAAGDQITNIDLIDATKQEVDDQIGKALREGANNRVRDLVRLKNIMVEEADAAIPEYAQARALFAGKAQLENAADAGSNFFKLKPREVEDFIQSMGESERRMFRLGAKQAIIDRAENLQVSADAVKRLFGKRGDVQKLRSLFPDQASFDAFQETLEREANFVLTRRAAQANSTTARQLTDASGARDAFAAARALSGDPAAAASTFGSLFSGLSKKKGEEAFTKAMEQAGDILLDSGFDPNRLQALLRRGDADRIKSLLEDVLIRPSTIRAPTARAAAASLLTP